MRTCVALWMALLVRSSLAWGGARGSLRSRPWQGRTVLRMASNDLSVTQLKELLDTGEVAAAESVISIETAQLIDVREPNELQVANYPTPGTGGEGRPFLNLPLSQFEEWGPKIARGELLDPKKPVVVGCKVGGRSGQVRTCLSSLEAARYLSLSLSNPAPLASHA